MLKTPSRNDVHHLFNAISPTYDLVNTLLSFGVDNYWRNVVISRIPKATPLDLLDLATGTGDQVLSILKRRPQITAIGIDTAGEMLKHARYKADRARLSPRVSFQEADAMQLPFKESRFDILTMSFGIRNVSSTQHCFQEMYRVLKPGGIALILEFSLPQSSLIRHSYLLYLRHLLPTVGRLISKHPTAYTYLNQTIETFPHGKALCNLMEDEGFHTSYTTHTFGVVSVYVATKPPY